MKQKILFAILNLIFIVEIAGQNISVSDSVFFTKFIYENMHYPLIDFVNGIEGTSVYQFDTDSVGRINNLQEIESSGSGTLDIEAKRLIYEIPREKFEVNQKITISIPFNLADNKIYRSVEEMPEFKGGFSEMMKFINKHLHYPIEASEMSIQGRVICGFIVEKDGAISNISVFRSIYTPIDAEAIRVIAKMPKWNAGKQNGKPVRVYFLLPIMFKL
ncbi:MAG: energy transducer TonB [Dysgonamonadaceae bacterium]|jgi:TonB family protein|nr:energy transducer TonB [Dysgonamonadaceae bacterium]